MRVYLAAAWSRRAEIALVADRLRALGIEVTSRWLVEETDMSSNRAGFLQERAEIDLADVDAADALVRFTDVAGPTVDGRLISGARMVEFGYAYARGKRLYVCGGRQNVFDYLADVIHVADVDMLCARLVLDSAKVFMCGQALEEGRYYVSKDFVAD